MYKKLYLYIRMLENIMDILGRETEGLTPELFY